eukprot:4712733-Alexandrium_andersonii.AAC.1
MHWPPSYAPAPPLPEGARHLNVHLCCHCFEQARLVLTDIQRAKFGLGFLPRAEQRGGPCEEHRAGIRGRLAP